MRSSMDMRAVAPDKFAPRGPRTTVKNEEKHPRGGQCRGVARAAGCAQAEQPSRLLLLALAMSSCVTSLTGQPSLSLSLSPSLREATPNPGYIKAFYSSLCDAITTDPALASIPVDDHMVHRGETWL